METSAVQAIKYALVSASGLSKDTLHVYVGLAVFITAALVFRKPVRSVLPLAVAFSVAVVGEVVDMRDDMSTLGHWRWSASAHDVINTVFWPTVLFILARFTQLFGATSGKA